MINTLFTSQIFGLSIFYAPLSMKSVQIMQSSSIICVLIDHLPQLIVQCLRLFKWKKITQIMIASLIVSLVDIIFIIFKAISWIIIYKYSPQNTTDQCNFLGIIINLLIQELVRFLQSSLMQIKEEIFYGQLIDISLRS